MSIPLMVQRRGQTQGAQTITLASIVLPVNSYAIIEMFVGCLSSDNLAGGATRKTSVKKIAGVLSNLGDFQPTVLKGDSALAAVVVAPAFVNGAIELQVTGVAGKTIYWTGLLCAYIHVTPS